LQKGSLPSKWAGTQATHRLICSAENSKKSRKSETEIFVVGLESGPFATGASVYYIGVFYVKFFLEDCAWRLRTEIDRKESATFPEVATHRREMILPVPYRNI
jgi:hypothetical protein